MKKSFLLILTGLISMFYIEVNAQSSSVRRISSALDDPAGLIIPGQQGGSVATGSATATIVIPLEISKEVDLAFGNIAAGPSAGTITIATDGSRSGMGGVTLIEARNISSAAHFTIVGYPSATFAITLPYVIDITDGNSAMSVDNFVSDLGPTSNLDGNGQAGLNVGATLNVNAGQESGLYTGSFDVTVAYN
jgi:hypothetical protein